jgi:arylsulfatase A-like enzyme
MQGLPRTVRWRLSGSAVVAFLGLSLSAAVGRPIPLVLISIDGLRAQDILEADRVGLRVPHLRRLMAEGAYARAVEGVVPGVTFPSHTTLVTGVSPERHGILQNRPFDPLGRNADGWYWYAEDIVVPTLWSAARDAGLSTASVDWPVTVGADITYNVAQYWRSEPQATDQVKLIRALSTRGLLAEAEHSVGDLPRGQGGIEDDERRAALCEFLQETRRPALELCYFASLDEVEHAWGPATPAVFAVLERLDAIVGRVRTAAERSGGGRARVVVVSDHGFSRTTRELDLNEALRAAGLLQLDASGEVRGWRAFAWGLGGSGTVMLRDPEDRDGRLRVRAALLALERQGLLSRILEEGPALGGSPGAAFTVLLSPETRLVDLRTGFVVREGAAGGDHGYDPGLPEMAATLIIAGPGIPAGRDLGRVDQRDVAPTLAALLGVELASAEGRDLLATSGAGL